MPLILSRKQGESIVSDGPMRITVERINCSRVKFSCEADPGVSIRRGELAGKEPADETPETMPALPVD